MIQLYGAGTSRWVRPYWTLRELGIPFEEKRLDLRRGENRSPEFLALNPFGAVPVLVDGDLVLSQSAAICTWLADRHPEAGLIPAPGSRERALHDQWAAFVISDLEQPLWRLLRHTVRYPEANRSQAERELAAEDFRTLARTLEPLPGDHLVGGRFTVADILMTYTLRWATRFGLLAGTPRLEAYRDLHSRRPAFPAHLYT